MIQSIFIMFYYYITIGLLFVSVPFSCTNIFIVFTNAEQLSEPSQPTNLRITNISSTSLRLTWDPPKETGGAPIFERNLNILDGTNVKLDLLVSYLKEYNQEKSIKLLKEIVPEWTKTNSFEN